MQLYGATHAKWCSCGWLHRCNFHCTKTVPVPLPQTAKPVEGIRSASSSKHYWDGCFWHVMIWKMEGQDEERVGAHVMPSMALANRAVDSNKAKLLTYGIKVRSA